MILTKQQIEELKEAAAPMMCWLHDHCHPHVTAIVTSERCEAMEGLASVLRNDAVEKYQTHSECAAELLNAIKAYDAAYKRADELRYMLEQIVNFRSKTPEDRDDLLTEARKLLEAV
jgi:hypothetical protein